jgi:hypothetical protein
VTGVDGATTIGIVAAGINSTATVVVSGTDLDKITSGYGDVTGLQCLW